MGLLPISDGVNTTLQMNYMAADKEKKIDGNSTRMQRVILKKNPWKQHPTKQRLNGL